MKHWSDDDQRAARVREVFRSLAPKTWDVTVWHPLDPVPRSVEPVVGAIDTADAHSLIDAILSAYCDTAQVPDPVGVLHQPIEPSVS